LQRNKHTKMIQVEVNYHAASQTYVADDGFGNQITFKSDRENNEAIPISQNTTVGPMLSLLMACGACSAIDIVMILEKQRQEFKELKVMVSGEREQDVTPALWKSVKIDYFLSGNVEESKAQKAAELSVDKYCSVLETLRRAGAEVSFSVTLNS
jgi:putative redox protein